MKTFFDSSALVKRYIHEEGTDRVIDLCNDSSEIIVSIICITEVLSACNRLLRENLISKKQYDIIKNEFLNDIDSATVVNLTGEVIQVSINCLEKGTNRSLDALHIGAAITYNSDRFITGDMRQKSIAEVMGLSVESC